MDIYYILFITSLIIILLYIILPIDNRSPEVKCIDPLDTLNQCMQEQIKSGTDPRLATIFCSDYKETDKCKQKYNININI